MKKQRCIICGKPLKHGIIIKGRGICDLCEKRVITIKRDTDFYNYYKKCIKRRIVEPCITKGVEINCQDYHL